VISRISGTGTGNNCFIIFAHVAPEAVDFWVANFQQHNSPNEHFLSTAFSARVCRNYRGLLEMLIVISVKC
jgi:hypothetical protein